MSEDNQKPSEASNGVKSTIESLLFVSSKPLTAKELAKIMEAEVPIVKEALTQLVQERKDAGVVVLDNDGEYQMATQPKNSTIVKNFLNAELREKLTDATVEVLAIIAYRQPISKAEIEAIRGVNSQYSIRHLLMRGLIDKIPNPSDARGFLYQTTTEFLMSLGITSISDLPEFEKLVGQIKLPETPALVSEPAPAAAENATEQPVLPETPPLQPEVPVTAETNPAGVVTIENLQPVPPSEEPQIAEPDKEEEFDDEDEDEDDEDDE